MDFAKVLQDPIAPKLRPATGVYIPRLPAKQRRCSHRLQTCFGGRLVHSCRGPRDREATISGNVFVWEANSTGIDAWRDGKLDE